MQAYTKHIMLGKKPANNGFKRDPNYKEVEGFQVRMAATMPNGQRTFSAWFDFTHEHVLGLSSSVQSLVRDYGWTLPALQKAPNMIWAPKEN